jgi:predicted amidophosphoribosyltransferase
MHVFFKLLNQLEMLLGQPHCPRCKTKQSEEALCTLCQEALGFQVQALANIQEGVSLWQIFKWNRRFKRIWYGVKFYKRYGHLKLIQVALKQALNILPLPSSNEAVWVLHPPIRQGKPNFFAPFLVPICESHAWQYQPKGLLFQDNASTEALHKSLTKEERFQRIHNRFKINPDLIAQLAKQTRPLHIIIVDDFMTTGATLSTCIRLIQDATLDNHVSLHALVLSSIPNN